MTDPGELRPSPASTGLLSFYDRLRSTIRRALERRAGRLGPGIAEALLLVPDLFIFLVRLTLDPDVPKESRRLIGGALLYFVMPVDLLPEAFLGVGGLLDDLVLACGVVAVAFGDNLETVAARHWSGSRRLGEVVGDVSHAAETLIGSRLSARIDRLLAEGGDQPPADESPSHHREPTRS